MKQDIVDQLQAELDNLQKQHRDILDKVCRNISLEFHLE